MTLPRRPLAPLPVALQPLPTVPRHMPAFGTLPEGITYSPRQAHQREFYRKPGPNTIYVDDWTPAELRAIADHMERAKAKV